MSSGVDSGGIIAAAVMLPVGVAFGAGWLAWQGGKLIVEANRVADRQIAEKKTAACRGSYAPQAFSFSGTQPACRYVYTASFSDRWK